LYLHRYAVFDEAHFVGSSRCALSFIVDDFALLVRKKVDGLFDQLRARRHVKRGPLLTPSVAHKLLPQRGLC
jgi:hypothetical protein